MAFFGILAFVLFDTPRLRAWAGASVFLLLLGLGRHTPVFGWVVGVVPGLASSRFPVKFFIPAALAVVVLAGHGLDALAHERRERIGRTRLYVPALCLVAFGLLAWAGTDRIVASRSPGMTVEHALARIQAAELHAVGVGGVFFVLLALTLRFPRHRALLVALCPVLAGTELVWASRPQLPTMRVSELTTSPLRAAVSRDAARPLVFAYDQYFDAASSSFDDTRAFTRAVARRVGPHLSGRDNIHFLFDQDLNETRSAAWRLGAKVLFEVDEAQRLNLLRRTGHTHVVVEAGVDETPDLSRLASEEIVPGFRTTVFRMKRARPLPAFASGFLAADDREDVVRKLFTETTSAAFVVARDDLSRLELPTSSAVAPHGGTVKILEESPERLRLAVEATAPGAVLAPVRFDPGWTATVDGVPASIVPGELVWSLVAVREGTHEIVLAFEPELTNLGIAISAIGLVLCALLWLRRER